MSVLLTLLLALLASTPTVSLTLTQQPGQRNVHLAYTVTGPYEGRVCLDIDDVDSQHVAAICADAPVTVEAGKTVMVVDDVHGPAGDWVVTPVLTDTPGDDPMVKGEPQPVHIAGRAGPGISVAR